MKLDPFESKSEITLEYSICLEFYVGLGWTSTTQFWYDSDTALFVMFIASLPTLFPTNKPRIARSKSCTNVDHAHWSTIK